MFFRGWEVLGQTVVVGILAYVTLITLLRISGKRTLSKMNAFDLVVTVALGSTFATILLSKDVALAQGIVAFMVLIGLQLVITWLSVRSPTIAGFVKSEPTLLLYRGEFLSKAMKKERVLESEVRAALRRNGIATIGHVETVVLETDGSFSVTKISEHKEAFTTFTNIEIPRAQDDSGGS
ncbi:MAG: DUF421 domain-containing protein [Desulfuromonadaceae bacterium]|nr:DUF421 domain-containing protein [Desulfuromonadaceae bacterium]